MKSTFWVAMIVAIGAIGMASPLSAGMVALAGRY